jgi:hypothetical protein
MRVSVVYSAAALVTKTSDVLVEQWKSSLQSAVFETGKEKYKKKRNKRNKEQRKG